MTEEKIISEEQTATENQTKKQANGKEFFLGAAVGIGICTLTWLAVLLSGM